MPDNEPYQNSPHLQAALGRPVPASGYGPPVSQHEHIVAGQLAALIGAGDLGAARRLIHEAEHGLGPWVVTPWRLLETLADRLSPQLPPASSAQEMPAAQEAAA